MNYNSERDTLLHKAAVYSIGNGLLQRLMERFRLHDNSKLRGKEKAGYDEMVPKLKETEYGSKEYDKVKEEMFDKCLKHHYAANRHHPEHFEHGIDDMNIVDLVEMYVDWKAASTRSSSSFRAGLEVNAKRYGMSEQLRKIFENTAYGSDR